MAAISITAAEVRALATQGAIIRRYPAASTAVVVGKVVYVKGDGKIELADADDVDQAQARGIVVGIGTQGATTAVVDQMCDVCVHGPVVIGNTTLLVEGGVVYVSPTAGSMDQTASATSGDFNYIIGYAESDRIVYVQGQMVIPTAVGA